MTDFMEYISGFNRRLIAPIFDCEKDIDFACMNNVTIAKALGFKSQKIGNVEKIIPFGFKSISDTENYNWDALLDAGYMEAELADFETFRSRCKTPLGGGSYGPLTIVSDIMGVDNLIRLSRKNPEVVYALLERVTDYLIELAKREEALGADFYWIAEPLASLFSPKMFEALCGRYIKRIFDSIGIASSLHVCGNTTAHTKELLATGTKLLSIDWMTDLETCLTLAPADVVIMGNIDPVLIWQGTKEELLAAAEVVLETAKDYKNFIMSSGCLIPRDTPLENVEAIINITKAYPVYSDDEYELLISLRKMKLIKNEAGFDKL